MSVVALNHINIAAPAPLLAQVRDFYVDVVGLEDGSRPEMGLKGYWLYAGDAAIVHLMARDTPAAQAGAGYLDHVAFTCTGLEATEHRLTTLGIDYRKNDFPERGFAQLIVRDPTGLGVELNFSLASA
ncbi:diguanylate cyclase [Mangrovimicrobium sediminis]|uniref:Diguanylate cyclase n=1 Tax=Mangrovimicrobium sediminis TaxID=2562682 RepID=A0A4Z0M6Y2_9GAMM|nr:diguanylate cyclase [Haliea sp. SAOS-164]TGD75147.1 diguanylate cyclase [Haliea sp. SAOS-164]